MRKILLFLFVSVIALAGCSKQKQEPVVPERQHVYHTYYGDIDIDTMRAIVREGSEDCYLVKWERIDSLVSGVISGPEWIAVGYFYCPATDNYYSRVFDSEGNYGDAYVFNPYEEDESTE